MEDEDMGGPDKVDLAGLLPAALICHGHSH